jgi:hypothetical protein
MFIAVVVSFILLLPFTRSASPGKFMLATFPVRFIEDLSRTKPQLKEAQFLNHHCDSLSPSTRSMLTARLWRLEIPQSSNRCIETARIWDGPDPVVSTKPVRYFSYDVWRVMFRNSPHNVRLQLFEELRAQHNKALVQEAIRSLDSNNETMIVAAVKYLRRVSGKPYGYEKNAWVKWAGTPVAEMKINLQTDSLERSELLKRGFSAVDVQNDFFVAKEKNLDFMGLYLDEHFPKTVTSDDLDLIKKKLSQLSPDLTERLGYRKGILLFLLAMAETKLYVVSDTGDVDAINARWKECIDSLEESREMGVSIAEELRKIIRQSDTDQDGSLNKDEFKKILARKIYQRN